MEDQGEKQNDAITLSALSPCSRTGMPISVADILNDVAHTPIPLICYYSIRSHP